MQKLLLKIQVRTWSRGQKSWDLPIRLLCLPQSPWVGVVLLNYIKNEIEKAEVNLLIAGNQMPADNDKLLEKLLLTLSSGNMISSWINDIKSRSLPPGLCQESSSYLIVFFCSFSAIGQTGLQTKEILQDYPPEYRPKKQYLGGSHSYSLFSETMCI